MRLPHGCVFQWRNSKEVTVSSRLVAATVPWRKMTVQFTHNSKQKKKNAHGCQLLFCVSLFFLFCNGLLHLRGSLSFCNTKEAENTLSLFLLPRCDRRCVILQRQIVLESDPHDGSFLRYQKPKPGCGHEPSSAQVTRQAGTPAEGDPAGSRQKRRRLRQANGGFKTPRLWMEKLRLSN